MTLLAVFDGHRGCETAQFAADNVVPYIQRKGQQARAEDAMKAAFVALDSDFAQQQELAHLERVARMGAAAAGTSLLSLTSVNTAALGAPLLNTET